MDILYHSLFGQMYNRVTVSQRESQHSVTIIVVVNNKFASPKYAS